MSVEQTRNSLLVRLRDPLDGDAWERFVRIYLPPVFQLARRYGLQEADAADAAQTVLTEVHQRIGTFDYNPEKGRFRGWLKSVARSRICDLLEKKRRQPQGAGGTDAALRMEELPAAAVDDAWEHDYQHSLFEAALTQVRQEVHEKTFEAFRRLALAGDVPADVARDLEMTVGSVYIAKSRLTARLRAIVTAWEQEERDHVG